MHRKYCLKKKIALKGDDEPMWRKSFADVTCLDAIKQALISFCTECSLRPEACEMALNIGKQVSRPYLLQ